MFGTSGTEENTNLCFWKTAHIMFSRLQNPLEIFLGILDKSKNAKTAANMAATDWGNLIRRANGQTVKFANKWVFGLWAIPSYLSGRKNLLPIKYLAGNVLNFNTDLCDK